MKKVFFILLLILLVALGFWYVQKNPETTPDPLIKNYRNTNLGISFSYPKTLTASTTSNEVVLHHDIPYENHGDCDMVGDTKTYDRLTDFHVVMQTLNKNLVETMKELSPYIPEENFVNNEVIESPGFIDAYIVGSFSGYSIYEGAEGCGLITYYFPIEKNKTLVVRRSSIQALNVSVSPLEKRQEILAVPGVISNEKSEEIFLVVLKSLVVQ